MLIPAPLNAFVMLLYASLNDGESATAMAAFLPPNRFDTSWAMIGDCCE